MLQRFLLKTVLCFCALTAGLFLFIPSAFAANVADNSHEECGYLESYLSVYRNNDPVEMLKLQIFLKEQEGFDIKLSSIFDSSTIIAVRKFQTRYSKDILEPWGLKSPTGNVSITTRHKINDLSCGITTPLSETEKEIIRSYDVVDTNVDVDKVDIIGANTHDIMDDEDSKKEPSESNIITPIITIESLSEYLDATSAGNAEVKATEPAVVSTTSSGVLQNNLAKNSGMVGIPVGFISQFSLPILIALLALLMVQLYFFWQASIVRKLRRVTKRF